VKKFSTIAAVLAIVILAAGCGGSKPAATEISMTDLLEDIKDLIAEDLREQGCTDQDFEAEELPGYAITDLKSEEGQWALPEGSDDAVEGFMIKAGMLNADQIIVLKATPGKAESFKSIFEAQKTSQLDMWESYAPQQAVKVEDTIIDVQGDYVIYITYADADGIEALFNNAR